MDPTMELYGWDRLDPTKIHYRVELREEQARLVLDAAVRMAGWWCIYGSRGGGKKLGRDPSQAPDWDLAQWCRKGKRGQRLEARLTAVAHALSIRLRLRAQPTDPHHVQELVRLLRPRVAQWIRDERGDIRASMLEAD